MEVEEAAEIVGIVGVEAGPDPEEAVLIIKVITRQIPTRTKINKVSQVKSLTRRAPRPVQMSQLTRAPAIGRRGGLRLTAPTPWSAAGSISSLLDKINEVLASLTQI